MTSPTEHALSSKTCARSLAYPEPESSWLCSWASQTYQQCSHGQKSVTAWPPRTRIDVELGLRLQTSRKITTRKTVYFQLISTETRACLFAMFPLMVDRPRARVGLGFNCYFIVFKSFTNLSG